MRSILPPILPTTTTTNDSLIEIVDYIFLANTPLSNCRLEFWEMKQDTRKGETVEASVSCIQGYPVPCQCIEVLVPHWCIDLA